MRVQQIDQDAQAGQATLKPKTARTLMGCIIGAIFLPIICIGAAVSFFVIRDVVIYRDQVQDWVLNGADVQRQRASAALKTPVPAMASTLPPGNATTGAAVFASRGCTACHSLTAGQTKVGPPARGMWTRAANRNPMLSTREYLYESIVAPNAFVVPGFSANVMPGNYGKSLSAQQIADVLAYMEQDLR
jgi:cytochrome c2